MHTREYTHTTYHHLRSYYAYSMDIIHNMYTTRALNSPLTVQRQYQSGLIFWIARARNNDLNLK